MNYFKIKTYLYIVYAFFSFALTSCMDENNRSEAGDSIAALNLDTVSQLTSISDSVEDEAYELSMKLKASLPSINLKEGKHYIVEGDLLLDGDELYFYCQKRLQEGFSGDTAALGQKSTKMTVGVLKNGNLAVWPGNTVLKYSVLKRSFSNPADYVKVVQMFQEACRDWMKTCNVTFQYVPAYDDLEPDANPNGPLTFVVREYNSGGYLAMAFFPGDPIYKRKVFVNPSLYTTNISKEGILRHELGHVLGFRHEHIWSKDKSCSGEGIFDGSLGARPLTEYDPYSVMHYLCGGVGSSELNITEFDQIGARTIYGVPISK